MLATANIVTDLYVYVINLSRFLYLFMVEIINHDGRSIEGAFEAVIISDIRKAKSF